VARGSRRRIRPARCWARHTVRAARDGTPRPGTSAAAAARARARPRSSSPSPLCGRGRAAVRSRSSAPRRSTTRHRAEAGPVPKAPADEELLPLRAIADVRGEDMRREDPGTRLEGRSGIRRRCANDIGRDEHAPEVRPVRGRRDDRPARAGERQLEVEQREDLRRIRGGEAGDEPECSKRGLRATRRVDGKADGHRLPLTLVRRQPDGCVRPGRAGLRRRIGRVANLDCTPADVGRAAAAENDERPPDRRLRRPREIDPVAGRDVNRRLRRSVNRSADDVERDARPRLVVVSDRQDLAGRQGDSSRCRAGDDESNRARCADCRQPANRVRMIGA
jgi:hypothetical protein